MLLDKMYRGQHKPEVPWKVQGGVKLRSKLADSNGCDVNWAISNHVIVAQNRIGNNRVRRTLFCCFRLKDLKSVGSSGPGNIAISVDDVVFRIIFIDFSNTDSFKSLHKRDCFAWEKVVGF